MGLWGSFFGSDQRDDINQGRVESEEALKRGFNQFKGTRENYLDRSLSEFDALDPYLKSGTQANNLYGNALGLNGAGAQQEYYGSFENDPGYQALQDNAVSAIEGSAANRGGLMSGGTIRGITDRVSLLKNNMFKERMDRLAALGGQGAQLGFNTSTARSNLLNSTGSDIGNAEFGLGQLQANSATNAANATAQSRSIPINNLIAMLQASATVASGGRKA